MRAFFASYWAWVLLVLAGAYIFWRVDAGDQATYLFVAVTVVYAIETRRVANVAVAEWRYTEAQRLVALLKPLNEVGPTLTSLRSSCLPLLTQDDIRSRPQDFNKTALLGALEDAAILRGTLEDAARNTPASVRPQVRDLASRIEDVRLAYDNAREVYIVLHKNETRHDASRTDFDDFRQLWEARVEGYTQQPQWHTIRDDQATLVRSTIDLAQRLQDAVRRQIEA